MSDYGKHLDKVVRFVQRAIEAGQLELKASTNIHFEGLPGYHVDIGIRSSGKKVLGSVFIVEDDTNLQVAELKFANGSNKVSSITKLSSKDHRRFDQTWLSVESNRLNKLKRSQLIVGKPIPFASMKHRYTIVDEKDNLLIVTFMEFNLPLGQITFELQGERLIYKKTRYLR